MTPTVRGAAVAFIGLAISTTMAFADPPEPSLGSFPREALQAALRQALEQPFSIQQDCGPGEPEPVLHARTGPAQALLNSDDNDTVHYPRGHTLLFHVFIDHQGGSWSGPERDAAAAKGAAAKTFYVDQAPANANVLWDNYGTTGYYYYQTGVLGYDIPNDGMTNAIAQDAIASFGFTDTDGDGTLYDEFSQFWQNWNGGWDNVVVVFQPADRTGRANASGSVSRIFHYTDDASSVWRHEMGHLFGECDEYVESGKCNNGVDCGACQSNYLAAVVNNGNCQLPACAPHEACVMIDNSNNVCSFTTQHWAWVDSDNNGLLDAVKRPTTGGSTVNIFEMFHNGFYNHSTTTSGFVAAQQWDTWAVYGIRSPAGSDYDLRMYHDNNHNFQVATSSLSGSSIDFIVADYNHARKGNEHFQPTLFAGPQDPYNITWESGTGTLYPDGSVSGAQTWNDYNVVRVYEVPLFANETVTFNLDIVSGSLNLGLALYKSNGTPYYAGRSATVASDDNGGVGVSESITYTAPTDDIYGLVVWANTTVDGTFTIQIGPTPVVLAEESQFNSGVDLRLFNYDPSFGYWALAGTRPDGDANTTVSLFTDAQYLTEQVRSDYPGQQVDFVAVDYNHASAASDYLRVSRESGTGTYRTEWEQGPDLLTGIALDTWVANDIGEIWDASLTSGTEYFVRQYHDSPTFDTGLYLYGSNGGDYYKARADYAASANFRAASVGGEWFSYTAPATDVYGVAVITNNDAPATLYSVWLGPRLSLADDVAVTRADEVVFGSAAIPAGQWNIFGVRPAIPAGQFSISLYGDAGYSSSDLKVTDQTNPGVRFVVGDWNHNPAGTYYPRTWRDTGSGNQVVEWEGEAEALTFNNASATKTNHIWAVGEVAEIWDVLLPAGVDVGVQVEDQSGNLDLGVELFKSNGAEYYARRGQGVAGEDAAGLGGTENFIYHTTALDFYGLAVWSNNSAFGGYSITLFNPTVVSVDGGNLPRELSLAASPNPSRTTTAFAFALPRTGDAQLAIFDLQGRQVRLVDRAQLPAGEHRWTWNGQDDQGQIARPGIYLARLQSGGEERRVKIVRAE